MEQTNCRYDAFISYRHQGAGIETAALLQRLLETYRSPCHGRFIGKGQSIGKIFTDKSEMPLSADLGGTIKSALEQSRYLIVIATPEYSQSKWCMAELEYFLRLHGGKTNRILFLLLGGAPEDAILTPLKLCGAEGFTGELLTEPVFADITGSAMPQIRKKLQTEFLRIAAPMIGCGYDDLYRRNRRRSLRKTVAAAALAGAVILGGVLLWKASTKDLAKEKEVLAEENQAMQESILVLEEERDTIADNKDIDNQLSEIKGALTAENRLSAIKGMQTLWAAYGGIAEYAERIEGELSPLWIKANYCQAFDHIQSVEADCGNLILSSDGQYIIGWRYDRETGLQVRVFDLLLNEEAACTLETEATGAGFTLYGETLDYDRGSGRILHYSEEGLHSFQPDGTYLSTDSAVPIPQKISNSSRELRLYNENCGPNFYSDSGLLYFLVNTDDPYAPYDPFRQSSLYYYNENTGDEWWVADLKAPEDSSSYDCILLTEDERFVIVTTQRGIYETQIQLYDMVSGAFAGIFPIKIEGSIFADDIYLQWYAQYGLVAVRSQTGITAFRLPKPQEQDYYAVFQAGDPYSILLTEEGYGYMTDSDGTIHMTACRDISLLDALTGQQQELTLSSQPADNLLFTGDPHTLEEMEFPVENILFYTLGVPHRIGPVENEVSGGDSALSITDTAGHLLLQLVETEGFAAPYYNEEDRLFGFIDYETGDTAKAFRLYTFEEFTELLGKYQWPA